MHAPLVAAGEKPVIEKFRTITLTNRAPIRIKEHEWPIIAQGCLSWDAPWGDGEGWEVGIYIRDEKKPGNKSWEQRCIIHAKYRYAHENPEKCQTVRVGRMLDSRDLTRDDYWKQILEVGNELHERIDLECMRKYAIHALDQCFAALNPWDE